MLISNHPSCGGTHLPDITVITPVFDRPGGTDIVFYVASRGHHADIGGLLPGSMPPKSTELWQEGAAIESDKIVSNGIFDEQRMTELLLHQPSQYEGCSGTRCLADNLSDLRAQIAAKHTRHTADSKSDIRIWIKVRSSIHVCHSIYCRDCSPQPASRAPCSFRGSAFGSNRLHGRRDTPPAQSYHQSRVWRRHIRLRWHRSRSIRQYQRPRCHHPFRYRKYSHSH